MNRQGTLFPTATSRSHASAPHASPTSWLAARRSVRTIVAERLSPAVANALLPVAAGEAAEAPFPDVTADSFAALAAVYPTLLATTARKQSGTWYTPDRLAEPTVARALGPLLERLPGKPGGSLRICDPAVGGGTFLIAALRYLQRSGVATRRAALWLHGVDIDSTAAALAALAVHEACGEDAPDLMGIAAHIRAGDGLDGASLPNGAFDAVLTNPPWETLQSTDGARERVAELRPRFRHQGAGKLYTYRLFLERAHQLLRTGGRFGLLVPASLWFDRDAGDLRRLLLEECRWEWLFGFENRRKLFAIDSRYRFAVVIGEKGGSTARVKTAFGRTELRQWSTAEPEHVVYDVAQLRALSPRHCTFVECESRRDLAIFARVQTGGRPLAGPDGAFAWRQGDFNMTSDRARFVLRSEAEARGFVRGDDAVWRDGRGAGEDLVALWQGAMIYDLHPNAGAHRDGVGHATTWEPPSRHDDLRPQYLVAAGPWLASAAGRPAARIALRALSNATNERTAIACLLPDVPCGNSLGVLVPAVPTATPLRAMAAGAAVLGSLPFDWVLRRRLTGTNLNGFVLADCMVPRLDAATETELARLALRLCALLPWHGGLWRLAAAEGWCEAPAQPAIAEDQRRELFARLDALAGRAFGLTQEDVAWIANDEGPRGFRRIDRDVPSPMRRPMRWLAAVE